MRTRSLRSIVTGPSATSAHAAISSLPNVTASWAAQLPDMPNTVHLILLQPGRGRARLTRAFSKVWYVPVDCGQNPSLPRPRGSDVASNAFGGNDDKVAIGDGVGRSAADAHVFAVPLVADSVASPRLVYGTLDLRLPDSTEQGYAALYFEVARSGELGRVTFEGLDAVRGARGEYSPYDVDRYEPDDWVFVVQRSAWLSERHDYEMHHYRTPLLDTHQHYVFAFHDEFVEAVAEGIWLDLADRDDPFAAPASHPLSRFSEDLPAEEFTSTDGLRWQLRRSARTDAELVEASRYCSQRVYQFNLTLDGASREAASIWVRTHRGRLVSRFTQPWPVGEVVRAEGFAQPGAFAPQWENYLGEVAHRRRQMGKHQR